MESILISIKQFVGVAEEYHHFDPPIIMHINSVFSDLWQLGVGPVEGFAIEDDTSTWGDFISLDDRKFNAIKSYMELRVKLLFDPPLNASVLQSMQREVDKWEWRLNVAAETTDGGEY